jgi:hypothetical protein
MGEQTRRDVVFRVSAEGRPIFCPGADDVAQENRLAKKEAAAILKIDVDYRGSDNGDSAVTVQRDELVNLLEDVFGTIARLKAGGDFDIILHEIAHKRDTAYAKDFMMFVLLAEARGW